MMKVVVDIPDGMTMGDGLGVCVKALEGGNAEYQAKEDGIYVTVGGIESWGKKYAVEIVYSRDGTGFTVLPAASEARS